MKIYIKTIIGLILGALLGFAYYYFFGCNSQSCSLNSNWYFPTLFGAIAGLILSFPSSNRNSTNKEINNEYKQRDIN